MRFVSSSHFLFISLVLSDLGHGSIDGFTRTKKLVHGKTRTDGENTEIINYGVSDEQVERMIKTDTKISHTEYIDGLTVTVDRKNLQWGSPPQEETRGLLGKNNHGTN